VNVKVIKNEKDYDAAFAELDHLMDLDPEPDTPEGDRLELISLLIEDYEKRKYPIDLPDPIEAIKFRMDQQELKQRDLVPHIGSAPKVSEVLNRKRPLSLKMMRSLHKNLGIPAEVLLHEQGASLPKESSIEWERFPLKEMYNRNWFKNAPDSWALARDMAEELVKPLLNAFEYHCQTIPLNRKTKTLRAAKNIDIYSWVAWAARVVDRARQKKLEAIYKPIDETFMNELARLSIHSNSPRLAFEFLNCHGIHAIVEPHLPNTLLDGAAMMLKDGTPVIALTIRHDRIDNFWFSLMHEVAHLKLHLGNDDRLFLDDLDYRQRVNSLEREADELTHQVLIPSGVWDKYKANKYFSKHLIKQISMEMHRSPAIVAGYIRYMQNDYVKYSDMVGSGKVRKLFPEFNSI
jgi:HTH-type transcriptional regulator/antitoxin HigA